MAKKLPFRVRGDQYVLPNLSKLIEDEIFIEGWPRAYAMLCALVTWANDRGVLAKVSISPICSQTDMGILNPVCPFGPHDNMRYK